MKLVFHSVTPGRYASIPTWVLSPKIKEESCRVYDDTGLNFLDINLDALRDLVAANRLMILTSDDNSKFIPSFAYIRYFR